MIDKTSMTKRARKLLKLLYKIYSEDENVRRFGIYPWSLTSRAGIRFGSGGDALGVVYLMWRNGWIRILSSKNRTTPFRRVQITLDGMKEAQAGQPSAQNGALSRGLYPATVDSMSHVSRKQLYN